jgi:hypothetical protein
MKNAATEGIILHCFKSFHNTEASERVGISLYIFWRSMSVPAWVRIQLIRFVLFHRHRDFTHYFDCFLPLCCYLASRNPHHSSRSYIMSGKVFFRLVCLYLNIFTGKYVVFVVLYEDWQITWVKFHLLKVPFSLFPTFPKQWDSFSIKLLQVNVHAFITTAHHSFHCMQQEHRTCSTGKYATAKIV